MIGTTITSQLTTQRRPFMLLGSLVMTIILLMTESGFGHETSNNQLQDFESHDSNHQDHGEDDGTSHRQLQFNSYDPKILLGKLELARAKFMEKLAEDYGQENVKPLFETIIDGTPQSIARKVFEASPLSWDRMKRKVAMKLLTAQVNQEPQSFVWATGGHSASAGHGNLFNQSYTAILDVAGTPIFDAVGLKFTAKRHAMGSTSCGMEINCCIKEVFGLDTDVLSWDYGMTTGWDKSKTELYFHRAALLPNRPALVTFFIDDSKDVLLSMESLGLAVFSINAESVELAVPNTAGKTQEEIDLMPPHIRYFRCDKGIEIQDPCDFEFKYTILPNNDPCNERRGRVGWHPGWKWHALYGNLLTLFWIEIIDDALQEIMRLGSDPRALLTNLEVQAAREIQPMMSKNISNIKYVCDELDSIKDIPNEIIYWSPNYCHTARLPSEIRYQGILTESQEKGGYHQYDHGYKLDQVVGKANDQMPLTWDPDLYQEFCTNYELVNDHQDFFTVNSFGWSTLVLPNPAEKAYYGVSGSSNPLMGYISLCLAGCGWGCPDGVLDTDRLRMGTKFSMTVNHVPVQNYTGFRDCVFLKHANGHKWEANDDGLFEISAKTENAGDYARISTIVIW